MQVLEETKPDIALIDVMLPGVSGIEVIKRIRTTLPATKCVVLSGAVQPQLILDAFNAGALGYLPKSSQPEEFQTALEQVSESNWYLSPTVTRSVLELALSLRVYHKADEAVVAPELALTDRERELLKLVAEGNTFTEIAKKLSINARSVERLKTKLQEKLEAENLADLIRQAIKLGIVQA